MALILSQRGCHVWVHPWQAVGPLLSIHGHRLDGRSVDFGGPATPADPDEPADDDPPTPTATVASAVPPGVIAAGAGFEPFASTTVLVLPGAAWGVLELVRIGPFPLLLPNLAPHDWVQTHFAGAQLSHPARLRRLQTIAQAMACAPGHSIPQLFTRWYDVKAAYELFNHPEATPDHIQAGHRQWVRDQLSRPGEYLLIEDTTVVSYPGRQPIPGLGSIGHSSEGQKGFHLHSVLAVRWPGGAGPDAQGHRPGVEVIGFLDQQYDIRTPHPSGRDPKTGQPRVKVTYKTVKTPEEWGVWERATDRIGPAPEATDVRWVRVADREADMYEYVCGCRDRNQGFVVRAAQDRVVVDPTTGKRLGLLFDVARGAGVRDRFALELRARDGHPARTATLAVGAVRVGLRAPARKGDHGQLPPWLPVSVVRVWEEAPPPGVEVVEWILVCDAEVGCGGDAVDRALQYACRWLIEEFHKALKTGLGAERLQLEEGHRLFAAVAVQSIVALRLIGLRERVRVSPDGPAEESGLSGLELQVLSRKLHQRLETVSEVILAVGRLGGHLNRKSDGPPGWQTLWQGMLRLGLLVEGYQLAQEGGRDEFG